MIAPSESFPDDSKNGVATPSLKPCLKDLPPRSSIGAKENGLTIECPAAWRASAIVEREAARWLYFRLVGREFSHIHVTPSLARKEEQSLSVRCERGIRGREITPMR
jgi:hypothetical protein